LKFIDKLFAVYAENSDAGIHAAAEWLLRTWGEDDRIRGVTVRLRASESQLRKRYQAKFEGERWYVNREGQTMVVLPGPVQFLMGPPDRPRLVGIPKEVTTRIVQSASSCDTSFLMSCGAAAWSVNRTFAIGAKAVTVGEFRRRQPHHQLS